ncbi:hypothetical protein [Arthrobacter sp.]|uniref:hypothetical protein n=1 Tax=Arthrobacter sp. TaxID=1667 RepID=UPI003A8DE7FB
MDTPLSPVTDLGLLEPCDVVEARRHGHLHCRGRVEATAPRAGVVWVRDDATGERLMLHADRLDVALLSPGFLRVA